MVCSFPVKSCNVCLKVTVLKANIKLLRVLHALAAILLANPVSVVVAHSALNVWMDILTCQIIFQIIIFANRVQSKTASDVIILDTALFAQTDTI